MAMPTKRNTLATLKRMRKLIARAWIQNYAKELVALPSGRRVVGYCLVGANDEAGGPGEASAGVAVQRIVHRRFRVRARGLNNPSSMTAFNDHPKTTQTDVLKVIDLAIEDASSP